MNRIHVALPVISRVCVRQITTSGVKNIRPDISHIKKKQMEYQMKEDVPVYLKGGVTDKILYYITLAMTAAGVGISLNGLYELSKK